ncbi:MAG TPA: serine hydroxymethyltransferase [Patescibacteria group bacterium]|nr:serine hydroxymethyltransferase [Patescibacteria group bacterium]
MTDPIFNLIAQEEKRQEQTLTLIPSENYTYPEVRQAVGSVLMHKYAEGYPGKRYYQGNTIVDQIENLAIDRARKLFNVPHVNVQPYSGSPANLAILAATCQVGDIILSQRLSMGGHLSMGQEASVTSKYYQAHYYGLTKEGEIDWDELEEQAWKLRPKVIFCGGTAYTKIFDFHRFAEIAEKVGAFFVADISHIGGLVAGGAHPSPKDDAHLIMTTTHKTLRGPRGAMIMVTQKGLSKDPQLAEKIDKAVFPGSQGGPHMNQIGALAVALRFSQGKPFRQYAEQVVKNSRVLAQELIKYGFNLVGGGSENHMIWIDLRNKGLDGWTAAWGSEAAGIICNRQTIPGDLRPPYYPSGLRLGTPAVTTRGMKEAEMIKVGKWFNQVIEYLRKMDLTGIGETNKEEDQKARARFKKVVLQEEKLQEIGREVKSFCQQFPIP